MSLNAANSHPGTSSRLTAIKRSHNARVCYLQPEWWCRDPANPGAEAMRLAKVLKLRPDVIATLQRECTAQQAVGLLWLLQGGLTLQTQRAACNFYLVSVQSETAARSRSRSERSTPISAKK